MNVLSQQWIVGRLRLSVGGKTLSRKRQPENLTPGYNENFAVIALQKGKQTLRLIIEPAQGFTQALPDYAMQPLQAIKMQDLDRGEVGPQRFQVLVHQLPLILGCMGFEGDQPAQGAQQGTVGHWFNEIGRAAGPQEAS